LLAMTRIIVKRGSAGRLQHLGVVWQNSAISFVLSNCGDAFQFFDEQCDGLCVAAG
ncbi:hypothetical protein L9F63_014054, partial [Diploptera punctata]